jgi:hypothetical protein
MAEGQLDRTPNVRSEADKIRATGGVIELTVPEDTALSDIKRLNGRRIIAIEMPAIWTAAAITFLGGSDAAALHSLYDDGGTEISVTVDVDRIVGITGAKADALMSLDLIQLRSGTAAAPVTQLGADRVIKLLVK